MTHNRTGASGPQEGKPVVKPAVVFYKQLGDTVLLQPALAELARQSGAPVMLHHRSGFEPLVELMGPILSHETNSRASSLWAFEPGSRTAWKALMLPAGEKTLCLTDPKNERWYHRFVFQTVRVRRSQGVYRARAYWQAVADTPGSAFNPPELSRPPDSWAAKSDPSGPYILLHAGSSLRRKEWPAKHWVRLVSLMKDAGFPRPILSGGTGLSEMEHCRSIQEQSPEAITNLCGALNLKGFLHLVSRADMVVAVDGSASHLAASFKVPCVTLFGPTRSDDWHTPAPGQVALSAASPGPDTKPKMEDLDPMRVFSKIMELARQHGN